jgi:hypothetical protein
MRQLTKLDPKLYPVIMTIRESMMEYFKGDCVQRLTRRSGVKLLPRNEWNNRRLRGHERFIANQQDRKLMVIHKTPILGLNKEPNTVVLYTSVLNRSEEMRMLKVEIKAFIKTYLKGVKVEEDNSDAISFF